MGRVPQAAPGLVAAAAAGSGVQRIVPRWWPRGPVALLSGIDRTCGPGTGTLQSLRSCWRSPLPGCRPPCLRCSWRQRDGSGMSCCILGGRCSRRKGRIGEAYMLSPASRLPWRSAVALERPPASTDRSLCIAARGGGRWARLVPKLAGKSPGRRCCLETERRAIGRTIGALRHRPGGHHSACPSFLFFSFPLQQHLATLTSSPPLHSLRIAFWS